MKNSLVKSGASISLFLLTLTGCASNNNTTADLMRNDASAGQTQVDLKNQIARDWEKGTKLITTGEKRVEDGEKQVESAERDLKSGQEEIARGRGEIAEGQKLVTESERIFRADYPEVDLNQTN